MKNLLKTLYSAFLAGICIGIGGTVFLSVENRVVGAFLFATGLTMIVTAKLNLFTGKVGYALINPPSYLGTLGLIWLGNFAGTAAIALLMRLTRSPIDSMAMCMVKTGDSPLSIFILSIFCGALMYLAVNGYKSIPDAFGKYIVVILGVMAFILCGFEHCVANMFYFTLAGAWNVKSFLYLLIMTAGNSVGSLLFAGFERVAADVKK